MKPHLKRFRRKSERAITLIEIVCILAALMLLVVLLLPFLARQASHAQRVTCSNNLKQIGLAFRTWSLDGDENYPMGASVRAGGVKEYAETGAVYMVFQVMSNELSTPKILVCPWDTNRTYATGFTNLSNAQISYFVGLDAVETQPQQLLSGDRNLTNEPIARNPYVSISNSTTLGWTKAMHWEKGNVGFADGSVWAFTNGSPTLTARLPAGSTNRLVIP